MEIGLLNLSVLVGLPAVLIPPLLHLLRRRRAPLLDWGAMQFLPTATTRRRRQWPERLLLLLARMAIVALVVLALGGPFAVSPLLTPLSDRPARDVVLVVDGSYSMGRRHGDAAAPADAARQWARDLVDHLGPQDRAAVLLARQPAVVWQALTSDRATLAARLEALPPPRGNPDLPAAVSRAWGLLRDDGRAPVRQIIVLSDGQRYGHGDPTTLGRWEVLGDDWRPEAEKLKAAGAAVPELWFVDATPTPDAAPSNFALAPLHASHAAASTGEEITFRSALLLESTGAPARPTRLRVAVDGDHVSDLPVPDADGRRVAIAFTHRFERAGPHLVSLALEAAPGTDCLAADDEQHAVVEVVDDLPLLLIDGAPRLSPESSTFFLQRALVGGAVERKQPTVPRAVPVTALEVDDLPGAKSDGRVGPAVVVLADVPRLRPGQEEALERFLATGGGVLVLLGARAAGEAEYYNERLYRDGRGWLPAGLLGVASSPEPPRPDLHSITHPALAVLASAPAGVPAEARLPRWWRVAADPKAPAVVMARLSNGAPLLLEKSYGKGRVVLCTVPPDRGWGSTLPSTWEFPVLIHELVYYLAGAQADAARLTAGAPIVYRPRARETRLPAPLTFDTPEQAGQTRHVTAWPWVHEDDGAIGSYRVRVGPETAYFVTPPDLRESDLTPATAEDRRAVRERLPITVREGEERNEESLAHPRQELWWLALLGVLAMLCGEAWLTGRLAAARTEARQ